MLGLEVNRIVFIIGGNECIYAITPITYISPV
jgi:hypothetical protein